MKKMITLVLAVVMMSMTMLTANAEYYLSAIDRLDTEERNVFDSVLIMLEHVYNGRPTDFGFPKDGKPSEFRVLELHYFQRKYADYAYIRFVRVGMTNSAMESYYELSTETYPSEDNPMSMVYTLTLWTMLYNGEMLSDTSNGKSGVFHEISFTDGGKAMRESRSYNSGPIKRINDALDEYWESK